MKSFEQLLGENKAAVERYVKFRLPSAADADDVLQEVCVTDGLAVRLRFCLNMFWVSMLRKRDAKNC